ncbi:hypothetical protein KQI84_10690 [bacterium]|nr:hypothetical protein [bacterium]
MNIRKIRHENGRFSASLVEMSFVSHRRIYNDRIQYGAASAIHYKANDIGTSFTLILALDSFGEFATLTESKHSPSWYKEENLRIDPSPRESGPIAN